MRVFVVTKNGVLGLEPVAVFKDWDAAEEFCEINDDDFEDPAKAVFNVKPFTMDSLYGVSLSEEEYDLGERYYDDDDEDYDD